jgi:protein SCO1/2
MRILFAALIALALIRPALAGLAERDLAVVTLAPGPEARVPNSLVFRDLRNRMLTLGEALTGRPGVLVPVDYTCRSICGPALSVVAAALSQTDLQAGRDYRLIVVGIDPKDDLDAARSLVQTRIGDDEILSSAAVLTGEAPTIQALLTALGYRTAYDADNDQFAHPSGVVTLTPDGRVSRVLSALALDPQDLRLAIIDGGEGRVGGLTDRLMLLCYGFDAIHGIYTPAINRILQISGVTTLALLALGLAALHRRSRRDGLSAEEGS